MSVVLINPPVSEGTAARILTPPIGLAYLSAALKKEGIETELIDADALGLGPSEIERAVKRISPQVVGLTAMTPTLESAFSVLERLRPVAPRLVLGGAHASAVGSAVFNECPVPLDAVVCGEGEESLPRLARLFLEGGRARAGEIPGVLVPGEERGPGDWPKISDLDALPFPDRRSLPRDRYRHPLFGAEPVTSLITSRGCPYRCLFCDKNVCGKRYRARSAENVLAEIEEIVLKEGIRKVIIYDDLFTFDRERVLAICRGIVERGLQISWKCEGRVNRVDREILRWMKRAGCELIAFGVETAGTAGLEFLKKDVTVEMARDAFAMAREEGLSTLGYFMLGIPGETIEDEMETVKLAISMKADYAQFGVLSPFPGTELYKWADERGWVKRAPALGPAEMGQGRPFIMDGYWTPERLDQAARMAHRAFYFRPGYVASRLMKVKSAGELFEGARKGAALFGWWLKSRVAGGRAKTA